MNELFDSNIYYESDGIKFQRIWSMPNKNTFSIQPIKDLIDLEVNRKLLWIDPFANESKVARITNDLNPNYKTDYHLDALDFLKMFDDNSVDGVLFNPPYSARQISECYKGVGIPVSMEITQNSFYSNIKF